MEDKMTMKTLLSPPTMATAILVALDTGLATE